MSAVYHDEAPMRQCTKCKEWKPLTAEYFFRCKDSRDGFHTQCKPCQRTPIPDTKRPEGHRTGPRPVTRTANGLTKICTRCAVEKPLDQFGLLKRGIYGVHSACKACRKVEGAEHYARRYGLKREILPKPAYDGKVCRTCKTEKPLDQFPPDKRASDGLDSACRQCKSNRLWVEKKEQSKARWQRWYEKNGDYERAKVRQWYREHHLQFLQYVAKRNAIKKAAQTDGRVDYSHILERDNCWCYICNNTVWPGQRIAFDHVLPLIPRKGTNRQGGPHTEANIKLTHYLCNARKGQKLLEEMTPYERRGVKKPHYKQLLFNF